MKYSKGGKSHSKGGGKHGTNMKDKGHGGKKGHANKKVKMPSDRF